MKRSQAIKIYLKHNKKARITVSNIMNWDSKKTAIDNGINAGLTSAHAFRIAKMYNLKFVYIHKAYEIKRKLECSR